MQDAIVKEIIVKAPKERVYEAITDPRKIITWFSDSVEEGTMQPGERPIFTFGNYKTQIYVEAAKPFSYLAYRWVPGSSGIIGDVLAVPNTLVEFFIDEQEGGTKITLKESGFASLPPTIAQESFNENSGGWSPFLDQLEKAMNQE